MQAIRIQQTIQKTGELNIANLPVFQGQQVEVILLLSPTEKPEGARMTARQLLRSELIGLWKDRTDIADSVQYARQLRDQAQTRPGTGRISDDTAGQ